MSAFPAGASMPTAPWAQPRVRLLLINPRFPESFWSFRWALNKILPGKRALNSPLGLATLAALCPPNWDVTVVDENIESIPLEPQADIVGVCGMAVQLTRQSELLNYYRKRGHYVVAGGSYASLCPERLEALADSVVSGEAEYIWPAFCRDFMAGAPQRLYQESGTVDLADSPTPRFDLLQLDKYLSVSLQFSRGCPYRCEFCDIIVMFGFGMLGYLFDRFSVPLAPLILGLVLGPLLEENFRKLLGSEGSAAMLFTSPIPLVFMLLSLGFIAFSLWRQFKGTARATSNEPEDAA